jgi:hypothetical protein
MLTAKKNGNLDRAEYISETKMSHTQKGVSLPNYTASHSSRLITGMETL